MKTLSIETLAEKLNGKLWIKGDIKRIYLDRGYNTKKMSTKTYVFQRQDGTFGVNCVIDCPSQHDNWINKEQDSIIEGVLNSIQDVLSDTVYILTNKEGQMLDYSGKVCTLDNCVSFFTESEAEKEIDNCIYYHSFITMNRDEFDVEFEKAEEVERNLPMKVKIERGDKISFYSGNFGEIKNQMESEGIMNILTTTIHNDFSGHFVMKKEGDKSALEIISESQKNNSVVIKNNSVVIKNNSVVIKNNPNTILGTGKKYQHSKFGIGEVVKEDERIVEINFDSVGVKSLLKEFAKLTLV